ncbi:MAG: hypothetical protein JNK15_04795, partial [Planctomycetes bacterium]|nr:hypothetical protein [Planctomycetota bacterium]
MLALHPCVVLMFAAAAAGQSVLNVPVGFPTIAAAIAAAQPGDVVLVAAGSYTPFTCNKAITLAAQPGAIVQVKNPNVGLAVTTFTIPVGGLAEVVGIEFRNENSIFRHAVRVLGGTLACESCWFEGEVYGDAGLRVDAASVWLRNCRCTGQLTSVPFWSGGNVGQCAGLRVDHGVVAAVDCEFVGGRILPDGYLGAGAGLLASASSVHCVRCVATGGASMTLGGVTPNGHGCLVQNGVGTWLADCTLRGGSHFLHPQGGDALHNAGTLPVHLTRVTTIPGAGTSAPGHAIVGPAQPDTGLGLASPTVEPLLGSPWHVDYLTAASTPLALFFSDRLEPLPPAVTIEPTWVTSPLVLVGLLLTDATGLAV